MRLRRWLEGTRWRLRQRRIDRCAHWFPLVRDFLTCARCGAALWETQIVDPGMHPDAVVVARLTPALELVKWRSHYHLVSGNGYLPDDAVVTFPDTPWPDPDVACENEACLDSDRWLDEADRLAEALKTDPVTGRFLMRQFDLMGWPAAGTCRLEVWLLDHVGKLIRDFECDRPHSMSSSDTSASSTD